MAERILSKIIYSFMMLKNKILLLKSSREKNSETYSLKISSRQLLIMFWIVMLILCKFLIELPPRSLSAMDVGEQIMQWNTDMTSNAIIE